MMTYSMNKILTPMQKIFSLALLSSITLFQAHPVWASPQQTPPPQEQFLDGIAAVVNDQIILQSELQKRTQKTLRTLEARHISVPNLKALKLKVLNNIILEQLQKERVKQLGIEVSDDEVLSQLQSIARRNHLTLLQLRDQLNLQVPNGIKTLRENIHQKLLFQKLKQIAVISKIQITEGEINNYLKRKSLQNKDTEYHLQQIMFTLPEGSTPKQRADIKAKAQKILQRLQDGENFSQLAVRYSNGVKTLEGGDLGWHGMDSIPTFFAPALQNLQVNQISSIIQSPIGFHIIKLLGKRQKGSKLVKQYNIYKFLIL
jgi:peptidyl-prolyl cis-trans isomerase SurA